MSHNSYGALLVQRNAGSSTEQESQLHHGKKKRNKITRLHFIFPKGRGRWKGRGEELQLHWLKSILIMSHSLAVYMKDNGRVQLIMIGLPLQWLITLNSFLEQCLGPSFPSLFSLFSSFGGRWCKIPGPFGPWPPADVGMGQNGPQDGRKGKKLKTLLMYRIRAISGVDH